MNKIATLPLLFISLPLFADDIQPSIRFDVNGFATATMEMVAPENQYDVMEEYEKCYNRDNGYITVLDVYQVCYMAGWNVTQFDGQKKCRDYINRIAELSNFGITIISTDNKEACKNANGVWTITAVDTNGDKTFSCVGADGYRVNYKQSCHGGGGTCVREFSDLETVAPVAREFIYQYGKNNGIQFTCMAKNPTINYTGDDYILCTAGGNAYEFQFNSLNDKDVVSGVPLQYSSEGKHLCKIFGGKFHDNSLEKDYCENVSMDICNGQMAAFASVIGHGSSFENGKCYILAKDNSMVSDLRTIGQFDNMIFSEVEVRLQDAVEFLPSYLGMVFPESKNNIRCDKFLRGTSGNDDVLTCYVNDEPIDFVFDDLFESVHGDVRHGVAELICFKSGFQSRGDRCFGISSKEECMSYNDKLPTGVIWREDWQACLFKEPYEFNKKINDLLTTIGIVAAPYFAISGGVAWGIATVAIDVGIEAAFYTLEDFINSYPNEIAKSFAIEADKCSDSECAKELVTKYSADIEYVLKDLNDVQFASVSGYFGKLSDLLTDSGFNDAMLDSALSIRSIFAATGVAAVFVVSLVSGNADNIVRRVSKLDAKLARFWKRAFALGEEVYNDAPFIAKLTRMWGPDSGMSFITKMTWQTSSSLPGNPRYIRVVIDRSRASDSHIKNLIDVAQQDGYFVSANKTTKDEYFIALSRENIFGAWDNAPSNWLFGNNIRNIDPSVANNVNNLNNLLNKKQPFSIGKIHGHDVVVDVNKHFGQVSGRPIILVSVADRKIPFYISTGTAGKIDVETGKWEFFGGIGNDGWFNKGGLADIINHYDIDELKDIANMLDSKIGDLRTTIFDADTQNRMKQGGLGFVGVLEGDTRVRELTQGVINQSFKVWPGPYNQGRSILDENLKNYKKWFQEDLKNFR